MIVEGEAVCVDYVCEPSVANSECLELLILIIVYESLRPQCGGPGRAAGRGCDDAIQLYPRYHSERSEHRQAQRTGVDTFSSRAQWLSPYWPCQGHLPRFRIG